MEINLQPVWDRIKKQKKFLKLTNEELAIKADLPKGTLSKILSGETKDPKITTLIAIADALDVSVNFLAYGKEANSQNAILNNKEQNHIKKYRALDERSQQTVDAVLNNLYEIVVSQKETTATIQAQEGAEPTIDSFTREEAIQAVNEQFDALQKGTISGTSLSTNSLENSKGSEKNELLQIL